MKAKTRLILSKITFVLFIIFWQVETWFFIIRDGWHWKAISESEKTCDGIASFLLTDGTICRAGIRSGSLVERYIAVARTNDRIPPPPGLTYSFC